MKSTTLHLVTIVLVAIGVIVLWSIGPIEQLAGYHDFADQRAWSGVPHAANVFSNAVFFFVGAFGLARLWRHRRDPRLVDGWPAHVLFLVSLILVALGSAFYHTAPDDSRLVWDRLPIGWVCAGLLGAVFMESVAKFRAARPPQRVGNVPPPESHQHFPACVMLVSLGAYALIAVSWWRYSGDLRPYILLQAAPIVLIPLWQAIAKVDQRERALFIVAVALYGMAKAAEFYDVQVYEALGGVLSGHTLKHLLAAMACGTIVLAVIARVSRELPVATDTAPSVPGYDLGDEAIARR